MSDKATGFSDIYSVHCDAVRRYLIRRGLSPDDAADVCADVFVVAWSRGDQLPDKAVLPWLLTVARNLALAHHRKEPRFTDITADSIGPAVASAADSVISYEAQQMVWCALQQLDESDRELLMLTAWDGLTTREAAKALAISYGTVRVRLHRARKRFDQALKSLQSTDRIDLTDTVRPSGIAK